MFTLDERLKGLPASRDQVVQVHQSLNQPHLAIPGRRAGPATAYVVGLKGTIGYAVFVYLHLPQSGECAVYAPAEGSVPAERYPEEETEALSFVESMGFLMDNLNFRGRPQEEQDSLLALLPVFQREPPLQPFTPGPAAGRAPTTSRQQGLDALGKLFAAFALAALAQACAHVPTDKERDQADLKVDMAVQGFATNAQQAYRDVEDALQLSPDLAEAHHVKGLLLHVAFGKLDEALASFKRALALKPRFPEARTNLGNLYLDLKRYDDAIREYDEALSDVLYLSPFIAHGNKGWALYKKGDVEGALAALRTAVGLNQRYCLGYLQQARIHEERGSVAEACKQFSRYREFCPDNADANLRDGRCLAQAGDRETARQRFEACVLKATDPDLRDECQKRSRELN